jgi:hypothetical protein
MKEGMIKLQAVYRAEYLVFVVHNDKEMKEIVLNVFMAPLEHLSECYNTNTEYNLDHLSRLYGSVKGFYLLQKSEWFHHQLFQIYMNLKALGILIIFYNQLSL